MLALPEVQRAVDLQQDAYRLLLWLGTVIDHRQVLLDQAHDTLPRARRPRAPRRKPVGSAG